MTLLCADVTCAWAVSIAFWSLSRVFFWACLALVTACWAASSVELRVFFALMSAAQLLDELLSDNPIE